MPISQDRMISLISAAFDYHDAAESICSLIKQQVMLVGMGRKSATEALHEIGTSADVNLYLRASSSLTLEMENRHFRLNARANERRREAMFRARNGFARPEHFASTTSPSTLRREPLAGAQSTLPDDADDYDERIARGEPFAVAEDSIVAPLDMDAVRRAEAEYNIAHRQPTATSTTPAQPAPARDEMIPPGMTAEEFYKDRPRIAPVEDEDGWQKPGG